MVDDIVAVMRRTFAIRKKEELVQRHSTTSAKRVSMMTHDDAAALLRSLLEQDDQMNRMRRKVIAMAHQMGWKNPDGSDKADYRRIDRWMLTYRLRTMNMMDFEQLTDAVTQFEEMFKAEIKKNVIK